MSQENERDYAVETASDVSRGDNGSNPISAIDLLSEASAAGQPQNQQADLPSLSLSGMESSTRGSNSQVPHSGDAAGPSESNSPARSQVGDAPSPKAAPIDTPTLHDPLEGLSKGSLRDLTTQLMGQLASDDLKNLPADKLREIMNHARGGFNSKFEIAEDLKNLPPEKIREIMEQVKGGFTLDSNEYVRSGERSGKLSTGDIFVREDGKETLYTPDGGKIVADKDGSVTVESSQKVKITSQDGSTTIEYPNGDKVAVQNGHLRDVQRGSKHAHFNSELQDNLMDSIPITPPKPPGFEPWLTPDPVLDPLDPRRLIREGSVDHLRK